MTQLIGQLDLPLSIGIAAFQGPVSVIFKAVRYAIGILRSEPSSPDFQKKRIMG